MDMNQYLEIFIEESKEHLQGLNQSLLQLEQNPQDIAMLNEIFRAAHTIKGMAGTMGYTKMATLTHNMENVLHALRNNDINISTKLIDVLFECLDALENYVENIINSGSEGENECETLVQTLDSILKNKGVIEEQKSEVEIDKPQIINDAIERVINVIDINQYDQNVINNAIDSGINAYEIRIVLNSGCVLKAARAFIIFQTLERCTEIIKSVPKVEDIEDEKFDSEFSVIVVSAKDEQYINNELNSISEIAEIVITSLASKLINSEEDEQETEKPNNDSNSKQNVLMEKEDTSINKEHPSVGKTKTGKTVRVDIERLDVLMNLVSELIIVKTRLEDIDSNKSAQSYDESVEYLERITTNLHDAVMKVRMVPVETVFNRFPRMIRDISRELGKDIALIMSGEETELDRTVIDEIGDPLIHLLRNSADHGIESAEKRRENNKPETGHIYLRAYQDGNNVVIEVEDDGLGINLEKVRMKIIERGLISKEIAGSLSQKDIVDFLFKPSFSTADKVTDLSGRGVGLDVVKTKIEALGGVIEVETEMGKGSKFIIRLPLTLAIIQALMVFVGNEKYAIPLNSVQQILNISPEEIKLVQKQEVILLRNMIVPIVRLDIMLDVEHKAEKQKQLTVVVVKKGDKLSGFLVDSLIGQHEIVIKSLGKMLSGVKGVAGATILGDGNVALILDVNSIA